MDGKQGRGVSHRVTAQHYVKIHPFPTMTFLKALSPALREIRILCSQSGPQSAGTRSFLIFQWKLLRLVDFCSTRQFIVSKYPVIKKHNPDLPVLIREATGTPARVFARFGACTWLPSATRLTFRTRTWS